MPYVSAFIVLCLAVAVYVFAAKRRARQSLVVPIATPPSIKDNLLLVILRKAPANLEQPVVETAARRAWEKKFGLNKKDAPYVEKGVPSVMFVLQVHGNALMVLGGEKSGRKLHPPNRFFPDSAAGLWEKYSHDLSISLVHDYDKDVDRLELLVARLTAALCDKDSLAIFHPPTRRLWKLDQTVVEQLAHKPSHFFEE